MQKHLVQLVDDLDGSKAAETVRFGFDGGRYEIELSARNAKRFRKLVGEYVPHARRAPNGHPRPRAGRDRQRRNSDIRAWATANNIAIAPVGRIPAAVIARYNANS